MRTKSTVGNTRQTKYRCKLNHTSGLHKETRSCERKVIKSVLSALGCYHSTLNLSIGLQRVLRAGGPALLFENPIGYNMPLLANLFGTTKRVAMGMGEESIIALRGVGELLAFLKEPEPPTGMKDAWQKLPIFKKVLTMGPKEVKKAACQEIRSEERRVGKE